MAELSIGLGKVLLGLGNIGAGVGFGVAEKEKMNELDSKAKKLKQDVDKASDLYDEVYYRVAVNLDRVKKAFDFGAWADSRTDEVLEYGGKQVSRLENGTVTLCQEKFIQVISV